MSARECHASDAARAASGLPGEKPAHGRIASNATTITSGPANGRAARYRFPNSTVSSMRRHTELGVVMSYRLPRLVVGLLLVGLMGMLIALHESPGVASPVPSLPAPPPRPRQCSPLPRRCLTSTALSERPGVRRRIAMAVTAAAKECISAPITSGCSRIRTPRPTRSCSTTSPLRSQSGCSCPCPPTSAAMPELPLDGQKCRQPPCRTTFQAGRRRQLRSLPRRAENWLEPHRSAAWKNPSIWSPGRKAAAGFQDTKDLLTRAGCAPIVMSAQKVAM